METRIAQDLGLDLTSSLIVWKNGVLLSRAAAVFSIISELGWPWVLLLLLRVLPLSFSNFFYDLYARYRYQILGAAKNPELCAMIPAPQRQLFVINLPEHLPVFSPRNNVFISAQWHRLIIINYAVPAASLQSYVPASVELDDWQGTMLVSLVGFAFTGTSLASMTLPVCSDFEEINLRFYVKRQVQGRWQRAVVFIKEIVPFAIIAQTANIFYGERYEAHAMDHQVQKKGATQSIRYSWTDAAGTCSLHAESDGEPQAFTDESLAAFITEHYYGYAKRGMDRTTEYEVEHPRWRVWSDVRGGVEGNFKKFYPSNITQHMNEVHSVLLAEGSPVRVMRGRRLP